MSRLVNCLVHFFGLKLIHLTSIIVCSTSQISRKIRHREVCHCLCAYLVTMPNVRTLPLVTSTYASKTTTQTTSEVNFAPTSRSPGLRLPPQSSNEEVKNFRRLPILLEPNQHNMSSFAQVRSQARSLETEAERLLSIYSGYSQNISVSPTDDELSTASSIESNLSKVCSLRSVYYLSG